MTTITNCTLRKLIVLFIVAGVLFACQGRTPKDAGDKSASSTSITVETFKSGDGWGYEVKIEGKTKVKQPFIPAIEGNLAFDSEMEARRVGELVVQKMKKYKRLPSVTIEELDSLQIKY